MQIELNTYTYKLENHPQGTAQSFKYTPLKTALSFTDLRRFLCVSRYQVLKRNYFHHVAEYVYIKNMNTIIHHTNL